MRLVLDEIELGTAAGDDHRRCQGWKLFVLLLPRMLLFRPARGGLVPKSRLLARFSAFSNGDWEQLLIASRECTEGAVRVALEGDPIAPGNDATLQALQEPRKRPAVPRKPLPREVLEHQWLLRNLRSAREVLQEGRLA